MNTCSCARNWTLSCRFPTFFYVKVDLGYCRSCSHLETGHVSTCIVSGSLHVVLASPEVHMSIGFSGDDIQKMFRVPRCAGHGNGYVYLPVCIWPTDFHVKVICGS